MCGDREEKGKGKDRKKGRGETVRKRKCIEGNKRGRKRKEHRSHCAGQTSWPLGGEVSEVGTNFEL